MFCLLTCSFIQLTLFTPVLYRSLKTGIKSDFFSCILADVAPLSAFFMKLPHIEICRMSKMKKFAIFPQAKLLLTFDFISFMCSRCSRYCGKRNKKWMRNIEKKVFVHNFWNAKVFFPVFIQLSSFKTLSRKTSVSCIDFKLNNVKFQNLIMRRAKIYYLFDLRGSHMRDSSRIIIACVLVSPHESQLNFRPEVE